MVRREKSGSFFLTSKEFDNALLSRFQNRVFSLISIKYRHLLTLIFPCFAFFFEAIASAANPLVIENIFLSCSFFQLPGFLMVFTQFTNSLFMTPSLILNLIPNPTTWTSIFPNLRHSFISDPFPSQPLLRLNRRSLGESWLWRSSWPRSSRFSSAPLRTLLWELCSSNHSWDVALQWLWIDSDDDDDSSTVLILEKVCTICGAASQNHECFDSLKWSYLFFNIIKELICITKLLGDLSSDLFIGLDIFVINHFNTWMQWL